MIGSTDIVFLNGEYVAREEAKVSVDDRGFVFGDGVYEVVPYYGGRPLEMPAHVARLGRGLAELDLSFDSAELSRIGGELLVRRELEASPMAIVYLQVTRGAAPRGHAFPTPPVTPTVYAMAKAYERPSSEAWERGASAITVSDTRWGRVDVKTLQLLPNTLAQEAAVRAGVEEAVFVRDGIALEGAKNNLFAVVDGAVRTHPASNQILAGVTRQIVLELARGEGYRIEEAATPLPLLHRASEVFLTGSTTEVLPLVRIDGRDIGDGRVGPVARALRLALHRRASSGGSAESQAVA